MTFKDYLKEMAFEFVADKTKEGGFPFITFAKTDKNIEITKPTDIKTYFKKDVENLDIIIAHFTKAPIDKVKTLDFDAKINSLAQIIKRKFPDQLEPLDIRIDKDGNVKVNYER